MGASVKLLLTYEGKKKTLVGQLMWPPEDHFDWENSQKLVIIVLKELQRRKSWTITILDKEIRRGVAKWLSKGPRKKQFRPRVPKEEV